MFGYDKGLQAKDTKAIGWEIVIIPEIGELVMGHTIAEPEKYPAF
jgi:hypothetical protein